MVKSRRKLTGKIEHLSAAGDNFTALNDALGRRILLHRQGERRDGVRAGPQKCGSSKPPSQRIRGLHAATMITISPEKLHHVLRKAVPLVEVPRLEDGVIQYRRHLEYGDVGDAGDDQVRIGD